jgi:hypothetical protein
MCYTMEHDLEKDLNMKLILCIFEQFLGLKINFYRSEILNIEIFSGVKFDPLLLDT